MGCIVNRPGEMADADNGYVGKTTGTISLYRGREEIRDGHHLSEASTANR
jgi:(E)-4-hydroxy-3-methylbut-2-enyl-diphosphate synthase